ncbi:hypothetical protein OEA_27990 (plasmid) [Priestia megaterium NCT-2]|uniref:hypothetical protein n=1 Tax=Priestia megaterium TaxID=1404 RepID=UPI000345DEAF|nr:hypothetical protein [Priestia megaterium]AYE53512.1 hypothetical protein OEA_27990 [Priestia megaterium NCT-2]UYP07257.1 hypothetical protein OIJ04_24475 [Priestia megaterium]
MQYIKLDKINLKNDPTINEKWVQSIIANDPSILGLGDILLKDMERKQPRAGRLDLLFQDENNRRYCVELQLGKTDESHIIRTIEYWDLEKKRYPQYEHVAVIIAEDITSRFLNVISLFNSHIPIIAIQMNAIKLDNQIGLQFVTVLDETALQNYNEDEEPELQLSVDRSYWEDKATKETVTLADKLLAVIHEHIDKNINLKYNKFYIGLERMGLINNFITFKPRKMNIIIQPKLERSSDYDTMIENTGLDFLDYDARGGRYRIKLTKNDIESHEEFLVQLFKAADKYYNN